MVQKTWARSIFVLLLCTLGSSSGEAWQEPQSAATLQPLPVYVVDFRQTEPIREIGDLGAFATGLIDLRLLEIPSLTVHRVPEAPVCGKPSESGAAQTQMSSVAVAPSDYYVVRGSIEVRLPQVVLDYFVEECEKQTVQKILEDTQPFTIDHAREELTVAAHAIAYKIERATPPTPVTVELFQVEGDVSDSNEIQKTIQHEVAQVLSKSPSLEVTDTSEYRIGGKIVFQKNSSLFRPFAKATLQAELRIDAHARTYPISTLGGSGDALPLLYSQIAAEVQRFLPQVLLAEHLGLPEIQGNMKVDELLTRGGQLLDQCASNGHSCASAQDAIPLLTAATQQNADLWKGFWLLGRAQMLAWKYPDAAVSLTKASELAKRESDAGKLIVASDHAQILSLLGDAYRNIEKYDLAQKAYDQSFAILPSQPELYAKKALALRFGGKRLAALEVIVSGLRAHVVDTASLHDEAKNIIRALQKDEIEQAQSLFADAHRAGFGVNDEYALVLSQKWAQTLDANWTAENRARARVELETAVSLQPSSPDIQAEVYLNLARAELTDGNHDRLRALIASFETLPSDQVTGNLREWAERISARDHLDHDEFESAWASADIALHIQTTDDGNLLASEARLFLARQKEKAIGSSPTPAQRLEVKKLYRESSDIAAPLVAKRFTSADTVLVMASHPLNEDKKTREQFEKLVRLNPADVSALNGLMFVCSQYQLDANCAFSAAQKMSELLDRNSSDASSDYLNIAEVAVLTSNDAVALNWLDVAAQQPPLGPRNESLVYFYRLWIDLRRGNTQDSSADLQSWQGATQRFRQSHDQLNWIFDGVKKILSQEKVVGGGAPLLSAMVEALENSDRPLPTWTWLTTSSIANPK